MASFRGIRRALRGDIHGAMIFRLPRESTLQTAWLRRDASEKLLISTSIVTLAPLLIYILKNLRLFLANLRNIACNYYHLYRHAFRHFQAILTCDDKKFYMTLPAGVYTPCRMILWCDFKYLSFLHVIGSDFAISPRLSIHLWWWWRRVTYRGLTLLRLIATA